MFDILNTEEINAFACPGGYILISKGALRHAENEAELAHVLAHEVAHVGKKHMYDTLKSMTPEEMEKLRMQQRKNTVLIQIKKSEKTIRSKVKWAQRLQNT